MLRTYIFDEIKNNWIEEESTLLLHSLCVFLDEDEKIIYLWKGPKSTKKRYKKGFESLRKLISSYPQTNFQLNVLANYIPSFIKEKLDMMLANVKQIEDMNRYKFTKIITIRLYFIFSLISISMSIFSAFTLSSSLSWSILGENFAISSFNYKNWLSISYVLILVSLIAFILSLIIGIYEIESQVIIFSLIGLIICTGIILYLQQGIYLFLFQDITTTSTYFIKREDIFLFLLINLTGISIFEIPNIFKLILFIKTYRRYIF